MRATWRGVTCLLTDVWVTGLYRAASTPSEACAIFEAVQTRIGLLVIDIVMPEMHGPALTERLVAQRPDLRVVYVSGYTDTMPGTGSGGGRMVFLPKPFTASALIAAVQDVMALC